MPKCFARLSYQEIRLVADTHTKVNYMQKCLIFLAVLFSTSVWSGLDWNPYVMTHERFVHLSSEDKEQVIIKTMEMIVEMEGKYRKAVVHNQPNKELYEQYMVLVQKLQNLLISEAYAGDVDEKFIKRAQQFNSLLTLLKTEACIYAGYVSKLVNGRCTSPSLLVGKPGSKEAKIKAAYLDTANANANKSGKCAGPAKISCNPVIFGFKQVGKSVPFCVNTSPSEAHNAAYECMKVALSDNKEDALTDSKAKRLDNLKDALSDSTAAGEFNKVHGFIFKTCMCGDTGLNPAYTKYMKPHRTCFGMLNTLSSIDSKECSPLKSQTSLDAFGDEWKNYYGASSFEKQDATREVGFDTVYKDILSKPEMQRLCSPNPDGGDENEDEDETEGIECTPDCQKETVDGKEVVYCTVTTITSKKKVDGKIVKSEVKEFKEVKVLLEQGKTEVTYEGKDGQTYVCAAKAPEATDEVLKCELSADYADPKKPIITLKFINLKKDQKEPAISWAGDGTVDAKDPKIFNATATKEAKSLVATFTPEGAAPAAKATDDKKAAGKKEDAKPAAAGAAPNSCPISVQIPEDQDDGEKYEITTSLAPYQPADVMVKVLAVVTLPEGKTLPADYEIVWIRKGYKGPKAEVKKEEPTNVAVDTNGPAVVVKPPTEPAGEPPVARGGPGAKEATIDETRTPEVYSTCAQLLDDAKKSVAESCQEIPAMQAPTAPAGPAPRPPVFMTPSYNTRTMGIQ